MKKHLFFAIFLFAALGINAQQSQLAVNKGDIFTISKPSSATFQHIHFPRNNFIIKRGGIASMKTVRGAKVVVTDVSYDNGTPLVTLERTDGRKFFRHLPSVTANVQDALDSGELRLN